VEYWISGAQRAEVETLAELKLSFSPLLAAWFHRAPSNLHLLIGAGKHEQRKLPPPLSWRGTGIETHVTNVAVF